MENRRKKSLPDSGLGSFGSESDASVTSPVSTMQNQIPSQNFCQNAPRPQTQSKQTGYMTDQMSLGQTTIRPNSSKFQPPNDVSTKIKSSQRATARNQISVHHESETSGQKSKNHVPAKLTRQKRYIPPPLHKAQTFSSLPCSGGDGDIKAAFPARYLGFSVLDRRYTQPMLPWVMADIRNQKLRKPVSVEISGHFLEAKDMTTADLVLKHKLHTLSRFARAHQDPKCFAYLNRQTSDEPFTCHMFEATDPSMVPEIFSLIREASKEAVKEEHDESKAPTGHLHTYQTFEVMYVGKVVVSNKKTPPTFIDDAVDKFQEYEQERCQRQQSRQSKLQDDALRHRHGSGSSVRSLPSDLQGSVSVQENDLTNHCNQPHATSGSADSLCGGSSVTLNQNMDMGSNDDLPLGGSSSCMALQNALNRARQEALIHESNKTTKTSQEGINNLVSSVKSEPAGGDKNVTSQRNRTMLIQVGQHDISLISPDRKVAIFERNFRDISFCSQGIRYPEHFGFISRDASSHSFLCYVFQCASEAVVEEVMQSLKAAFHAAFQQNAKNYVVCELCPMHQLHKLCLEIDKLPYEKVHELLIRRVEQLQDKEYTHIMTQLKDEDPQSVQETCEVLMMILRQLCESKQKDHNHISDNNRLQAAQEFNLSPPKSMSSKLGNLKSRAKKSLTHSFENLLKGKSKRDDAGADGFRERSWTNDSDSSFAKSFDTSPGDTPDSTPCSSPLVKEFHTQLPTPTVNAPPNRRVPRRRSATIGSLPISEEEELMLTGSTSQQRAAHSGGGTSHLSPCSPSVHTDSAIINMFLRVGQSSAEKRGGSLSPVSEHASHKKSWRMGILSRVVTPAKPTVRRSVSDTGEFPVPHDSQEAKRRPSLSPQRARQLWKKAILQTLLLIRLNKEKITLRARQDEEDLKPLKLHYEEMTPCLKEVTKVWQVILERPEKRCDLIPITRAIKDGVPRHLRGSIWRLLVRQHRLQKADPMMMSSEPSYEELLKKLTTQQHAILIDLGRTFPTHPYFTTQLGAGQLSLFNILKAYSLLDVEVGYCQGLSFIAGLLLMHMPEEEAYDTLKYLMVNLGLRRQYRPDMESLQIQLYQLSRLLHDHHRDLYDHLEMNDIAATLYAAPWFLTLFASQFPLGFVARVFDMVFLQGKETIFKVALVLLGNHKELIKQCDGFEKVVLFLKTTLPSMGIIQMERIINQVFTLNLSKQLSAYEVEYYVLQEEMLCSPPRQLSVSSTSSQDSAVLQMANAALRKHNMELLEQKQTTDGQIENMRQQLASTQAIVAELDGQLHNAQAAQTKLRGHVRVLEVERAAVLTDLAHLRSFVSAEDLERANITLRDYHVPVSPCRSPGLAHLMQDDDDNDNTLTGYTNGNANTILSNSSTIIPKDGLNQLDKEVEFLMLKTKQQNYNNTRPPASPSRLEVSSLYNRSASS